MSRFPRLQARLKEKADDVKARAVTYVAFGDSVTQGCMEHATIEHKQVYHQLLKERMESRYPTTIVNVINSGVSGDTAASSRSRWGRDLLLYDPDFVTVGFGVNDCHAGPAGLDAYVQALDELVVRVMEETSAEVLLLTPSAMIRADNAYVHENERAYLPRFLETAACGYLQQYAYALREFASRKQLPLFDVFAMWQLMEQRGIDINSRLANGINHPDRLFHAQLAQSLDAFLFETL